MAIHFLISLLEFRIPKILCETNFGQWKNVQKCYFERYISSEFEFWWISSMFHDLKCEYAEISQNKDSELLNLTNEILFRL